MRIIHAAVVGNFFLLLLIPAVVEGFLCLAHCQPGRILIRRKYINSMRILPLLFSMGVTEGNNSDDILDTIEDSAVTTSNAAIGTIVSASTTTTEPIAGITSVTIPTLRTGIQRRYQTFVWNYNQQEYHINYRAEGPLNGPPIVLIHGFGGNQNHYRFQYSPLAEEGFRVYGVDLLGFGASPKPTDVNYSIEIFVQLVCDFIQSMQQSTASTDVPKPWIVAGNSIGGLISLGVAEKLKSMVRGVILFNCAGGMTGFRYSDVPGWVRPLLWFF
jgi:hypothetical protein